MSNGQGSNSGVPPGTPTPAPLGRMAPVAAPRAADTADLQGMMRPVGGEPPARTATPAPRAATPQPTSSSEKRGIVGQVQEVVREELRRQGEEVFQRFVGQSERLEEANREFKDAVRASEGEVKSTVSGTEANLAAKVDALRERVDAQDAQLGALKELCERILHELVG